MDNKKKARAGVGQVLWNFSGVPSKITYIIKKEKEQMKMSNNSTAQRGRYR